MNLYTYCDSDPINLIDPSGNSPLDGVYGWAKSVDDSIFFGSAGKIVDGVRWLQGKDPYDWDYRRCTDKDFYIGYKSGLITNSIYGIISLGSGLKKIVTSGGDVIVAADGTIVQVTSGSKSGVLQALKGAGISFISGVNWTNHGYKHFPKKNMTWKETVKSTKNGPAKYKPEIAVEQLERTVWDKGDLVTNGKPWKVMKFDEVIGASNGVETTYVRVEMSSNTIHGHPITPQEFAKLTQ